MGPCGRLVLGETASNQNCGDVLVPATLIPKWLTIDLAVIFVSLVIIGIGIAIGIAPSSAAS